MKSPQWRLLPANIMMRRRAIFHFVLTLVALLGAPGAVAAEPAKRMVRIGYLALNPPGPAGPVIGQDLAKLGYVDGVNLAFDVRHAGGKPEMLGAAAAELVKLKVDLIYAVTIPAALAAKAATSSIPIVGFGLHGAVESRLVGNLRRPGGNVTGVETLAPEIDAKRVQLFKELIPSLKRMAVVTDNVDQGVPQHLKYLNAAGKTLGVEISAQLEVRGPKDFDGVLAAADARSLGAIFMVSTSQTFEVRQRVIEYALANRLPSMCEFKQLARSGCLLSYGPTYDEMDQRNAAQIDKILRGTPVGELPIEQPTKFELVVNLKTAKALGITIPQSLLLRADEVIDP